VAPDCILGSDMKSPAATHKLILMLGAFALLAGACSSGEAASSGSTSSSTTSSTSTSTTSTTEATTTSTTGVPKPATLGAGSSGPEVTAMQQRLHDLGYDTGVDGKWGGQTTFALIAFQKVEGLGRSGRLDAATQARLATASRPGPMMSGTSGNRVEVDIQKQVLFLWQGGKLARILPVSTGNNKRYCVDGQCATAVTPGGSYKINRKINGLRVSRLGKLYNPLYFNGGIAIHGAPSVPVYPASHGCVRIPMYASASFFAQVPMGTPVYVLGGKKAPVPFNEQAPTDNNATTTTAAPTTTSSTTSSTSTTTSSTTSTTVP
jgi:peptidoglycan hydrolase-like protein with peptidoglycan-binding domain